MAESLTPPAPAAPRLRTLWLVGTLALTLGSLLVAFALAPSAGADPVPALEWLIFTGSSVHVAATGWLYAVPEVREHAAAHRTRYYRVPAALLVGTALVAALLPASAFRWLLLPFFGWQYFHFQKQNVGMAALAAAGLRAGPVRRPERLAVLITGCAGIAGLLAHPELLLLADLNPRLRFAFPVALVVFLAGTGLGLRALARRPRAGRPAGFVAVYLTSLLFFAPVFVFASPYAAVAGLILAHGYQYLLILGLVAGGRPTAGSRLIGPALMLNIALFGGVLLSTASHLHDANPLGRAVYGAYLGATMAHFVIDAAIWRLREEFPRRFLTERLPYLLGG